MSVAMHRHAVLVLLCLTLAACASSPPAALEAGHPAHSGTSAATPAALTILQSYRDFGRPETRPAPAAKEEENHDAHEH
jgi:starvation-inducible outer membrane lipoprotein